MGIKERECVIMEFEELPEDTQEEIRALKHGAYTIECDVKDALEEAKNVQDFGETVKTRMMDLIGEARSAIASFCGKQDAQRHEAFLTISLKTVLLPEALEKLEDEIKRLLESKGIGAVIENDGTGNTIVTAGVAI